MPLFRTLIICLLWSINPSYGLGQVTDLSVSSIPKILLQNANAVIRIDDVEIVISSQTSLDINYKKTISVLNKKADYLLDFGVSYESGSSSIHDIQINYFDEDGNQILSIKNKDIDDRSLYDGYSIINDGRYKFYDYIGEKYPVTIEYSYTIKSRNTCFIPDWMPLRLSKTSIEKSRYKLINSSSSDVLIKESHWDSIEYLNPNKYEYEISNIPAYSSEPFMPHINNCLPRIQFTPQEFSYEGINGLASDWQSYGDWSYKSFLQNREPLQSSKTYEEITKLILDPSDKRHVIDVVYKYIQNNTRYVSIQLDEGGFKPMSSNDVDNYKYGDCKALSFYLINLLNIFGIEANYVKINAGVNQVLSLDSIFYSHQQSNHAIVNIPLDNETIWLDPTSNTSPFNFLGPFCDNRNALEVGKNLTRIVKTPNYGVELNKEITAALLILTENGDLKAEYAKETFGIGYNTLVNFSKQDLKEIRNQYFEVTFKEMQQVGIENIYFDINPDEIRVTEKMEITSKSYAEKFGDNLIIPIKFTSFNIPKLKKDKIRKFDFEITRSSKEESHIIYNLPENFTCDVLPDPYKIESPYGSYEFKILPTKLKNQINIFRKFEMAKGIFPSKDYSQIKLFFDKVLKQETKSIIIKKLK